MTESVTSSTGSPRSNGAGPGPVPPWWRRAPFILLILSLVLAAVGAWEAHRAMVSHRDAVDGVLRDYAAFAAWTFGRHAEEAFPILFQATFQPVFRAQRAGAPLPHPDRLLAEASTGCECTPSLARSFAVRIPVGSEGGEVEVSGEGLDPVQHRAAIEQMRAVALADAEADRMAGIVPVDVGGTRRLVAVFTVGCVDAGGLEAIYGVEVDPGQLVGLFREIHLEKDLLPPTLAGERGNDDLLRLGVMEPDGSVLFGTDPGPDDPGAARAALGHSFGDLEVRASVVPEAAGQLVIGGLPRSRAGFMLGIFGLAILLGLVAAGQLRRENELALLRSDFVAGVSHELRTPLAQIRLFLETLRMGRFRTEGEREWSLATIDRETRRLSHLVENVLHFSSAEREAVPFETERLDLDAELREIEESFRPLARVRRARIRVEVEGDLQVQAHRESFRQVMLNLLDNAVKYGPRGQTIRLQGRTRGGGVEVAVEDQGSGVPAEDQERIWAPFQRGSRVGGRETGSGIGLAVVRELVHRNGGSIRVEDGPGGGARFVVALPGGEFRSRNGHQFRSWSGDRPLGLPYGEVAATGGAS